MGDDVLVKKASAASFGALLTALALTALEVVKTRLQVQVPDVVKASPEVRKSSYYSFSNGLIDTMLPKERLLKRCRCSVDVICPKTSHNSMVRMMGRIVRAEGPLALYAGLPPTLLTAVPSTAIYFTSYESMLRRLKEAFPDRNHGVLAMMAGSSARALVATIFNPLELMRVQMQASPNPMGFSVYLRQMINGGCSHLFAGLGATLARDIPFSALYWFGIETSKDLLSNTLPIDDPQQRQVATAFIAGVVAGTGATVLTHPFDVIKTRQQLRRYLPDASASARSPSSWELLQEAWRTDGVRGISAGLAPRVVKVAPACAIMISTYEFAKIFLQLESTHPALPSQEPSNDAT
ncbi:TPA: hypothetical protein N0F65_000682 [Lagenidium giganteum]|uniref:Mitochondrial carrier protein n=1 Tax=Lagenidium giganteum TaxID=4803 RepID=A0AAV2YYV6_9STRA|nr:TPA: hypothetical protein N0F65_000682 [Lagenidium giganteum]